MRVLFDSKRLNVGLQYILVGQIFMRHLICRYFSFKRFVCCFLDVTLPTQNYNVTIASLLNNRFLEFNNDMTIYGERLLNILILKQIACICCGC
jgi:hypothetical protein